MSIYYSEISPSGMAIPTGAFVYGSLSGRDMSEPPTGLSMADIGSPALRHALSVFEHALCSDVTRWHRREAPLGSWVIAPSTYGSRDIGTLGTVGVVSSLPNLVDNVIVGPWPSSYYGNLAPAMGNLVLVTNNLNLAALLPDPHHANLPEPVTIDPLHSPDPPDNPIPPAVKAVDDIAGWLGISIADALSASDISKRTYQSWKHEGVRHPRASSEGRLWRLHQFAEDLVETMGLPALRHWLSAEPERKELLRAGAIDELMSRAYAVITDPRPSWVGVGNLESYEVPRREIALQAMEAGDVVEPA